MGLSKFNIRSITIVFLLTVFSPGLPCHAQECIFKDSLLNIDFGTASQPQEFNLSQLRGYQQVRSDCPDNATFNFVTVLPGCFDNHWFSLQKDHTPGSNNGRMMIVNSASKPEVFFTARLAGFKHGTTYEFGIWMINVCRVNQDCTDMLPSVSIKLENASGEKLVEFNTGPVAQTATPLWLKFSGVFETHAYPGLITLTMTTLSSGVCGNDFAMDDITVRECYPPPAITPTLRAIAKITPQSQSPVLFIPATKPSVKQPVPPSPQFSKKDIIVKRLPPQGKRDTIAVTRLKNLPVPEPLKSRTNALVKRIFFPEGDVFIELYDNGIVDGDTVSIYDNNLLLISRAGLSEKPIRLKINLQPGQTHHELVMVAENLGSIPPNTSLMILTAKGRREEVFISSNEQKNAKLVIDLLE